MEGIKAAFVGNEEKDEEAGGHAYSQAEDIDKRIDAIPGQVTERDFEVVLYHD